MPIALAVAVGGAFGAVSRYTLDRFIEQRSFALFPWATFTINLTGCFLVGTVIASLVDRHEVPGWLRSGLVLGFIGGYTTFSTYAQETLDLLESEDFAVALLYGLGSIVAGVAAVFAGNLVGRSL
jgi:fluoride exporter